MNCHDARRLLFHSLDDGPAPEEHLQECERCRAIHESMRRVDELLREEPLIEPPPDLAARVTAAIVPPRAKFSLRQELLKIAAAVLVVLGLTAVTYSTLEADLRPALSGFISLTDLADDKIKEVRNP